jgi:two-component system response regulator PilR (NtrC family)
MTDMAVLVVDDERPQREIVSEILASAGYRVITAGDGGEAIRVLEQHANIGVVLTDLRMPGKDGNDVLAAALKAEVPPEVVLMTAFGSIPGAVAAIKEGAYDYLAKPFKKDDLLRVLHRAMEKAELTRENRRLRASQQNDAGLAGIIAKSETMQPVLTLVERAAETAANVLISGESGTGKEVFARAIHRLSERRDGPFVAINCGAIPAQLMESELFGHRQGAFTGANRDYPGRFVQADGGTLFLDEIATMRIDLQVALLRVLQERKVMPVGGSELIHFNVRVIAASNVNLSEAVMEGRFRLDLFHRLNVLSIRLPPLRQRPGDIPLLAAFFLRRLGMSYRKDNLHISGEALEWLGQQEFPGNVRQLENMLEKAVILASEGPLTIAHFQATAGQEAVPAPVNSRQVRDLPTTERVLIEDALRRHRGSIKAAAADLGISYKTLQYRIKKYGFDRQIFK